MGSFEYGALVEQLVATATAVGTTTLVNTSKQNQIFTGSTTQTIVFPAATTMSVGQSFNIFNQSSGLLTLQFSGGSSFNDAASISYGTLAAHGALSVTLQTNGTSAGTWAVNSLGGTATGAGAIIAAYGLTTGVNPSSGVVKYDTKVTDTNSAYSTSTGLFTAPVTGNYLVTIVTQASTGTSDLYIKQNGTAVIELVSSMATGNLGGGAIVSCNAGDTLGIYDDSAHTLNGIGSFGYQNYLSINLITGGGNVNGLTGVNGRYFSSTSTITGSLATVTYATKSFDPQSAYSSGVWTCQTAGKYQFNAGIDIAGTFVLNSTVDMQIQQTGSSSQISEVQNYSFASATDIAAMVSDVFSCQVGDTIKVQVSSSATAPSVVSSNSKNWISWLWCGT